MDTTQFVTKTDLMEALEVFGIRMEKMVGDVVGEIVSDALQVISERFDKVEARLDRVEARLDSLEGKFDAAQDTISHHTIDIMALQRKIA